MLRIPDRMIPEFENDPEPLPLNCPECGQPLRPLVSRTTFVYLCMHHGRFFIATEDGHLHDMHRLIQISAFQPKPA